MAKGENIFKRKDGRWEARYIKGHELSGKIKYGYCYGKTYKEAKEKVTQCKAMLLSGELIQEKKTKQCFSVYCDEWLLANKNQIKESTYVKYDSILERHIKPKLGDCYPQGFSSSLAEAFRDELQYEEKLAPKTVKDILIVFRSVLKYTAKEFPGTFPTVEVSYPKETKKEMRVLSCAEQKCLVSYLLADTDTCKFGILLALYTGIRIGELCALR